MIVGDVLLTVALMAMWQQGSVEGIGWVAGCILALAALESGGFTRFKAGGPNVNIEIEKLQEKLEESATAAATAGNIGGGRPTSGEIEYRGGPHPDDRSRSASIPPGLTQEAERARRVAIEQLMRDAALWGWMMAGTGFTTPPIPTIEWDANGNAHISYATGEADPGRLETLARRIRKAQQQPNQRGE